jgi:hypothetical protein
MMRAFLLAGLIAALPALAQAEDKVPPLRERINCFPAKNITKFVSKFENMDAEKRDIVDMRFEAKFEAKDGGVLPERIFMRENGTETDFTLEADGTVPDFNKIGAASDDAELCSEDPSREGTPRGNDLSFSIENNVHFHDRSGYHTLAAMKEGLKDGKSHYKKMVPAPMRMIVPKLSYVMIEYDTENTTPQYSAMSGDAPIEGLTHETFCNTAMIKIKDFEVLGGDGLKVMGGPYNLTPVPGPKTLAKFAGCSDDEDDGEEKE